MSIGLNLNQQNYCRRIPNKTAQQNIGFSGKNKILSKVRNAFTKDVYQPGERAGFALAAGLTAILSVALGANYATNRLSPSADYCASRGTELVHQVTPTGELVSKCVAAGENMIKKAAK